MEMRVRGVALCLFAVAVMAGCSGGGSTSSPAPKPTLGGAGDPAAFDQKITFTIDVPGTTATSATARGRKPQAAAPAATPQATTPYVSARTGSVVLTLAEINGISPQQAAPIIPAVNVPATCQGSTTGCTIPVANVPAALGTDRYFVQTFAGANATGNLISTGFVDVAVPVKANANPAIGGTAALSIGGYVARVVLAPATLGVVSGTASDLNVLVQGFDPAGAAIVGAAQYATAITVSVDDTSNFAFAGAPSVSVSGPQAAPVVLHYSGGTSFGTNVQAVTQDQNAVAVNASPLPVNVYPPGTPVVGGVPQPTPAPTVVPTVPPTAIPTRQPTPVPTAQPTPTAAPVAAMSLYVADGNADTVSEYRIASQIASGSIPNPHATPSRVLRFDPTLVKSPLIPAGTLGCAPAQGTFAGNGTSGVAVDAASGTIFVLPSCTDGTQTYVFGYAPNAVGTPAPTIYDPFPGGFGTVSGLVAANATVYASTTAPQGIYGFPVTRNGQPPTIATGGTCFNQFGAVLPPVCFGLGFTQGFAVDNNRFAYIPAQWQTDASGNSVATGDAAALSNPGAILAVPASGTNSSVTPYAAIAGLNASVGNVPLAATSDGNTLYVLTGSGTIASADGNTTYFPGLSACPPPSSNAPVNPVVPADYTTACADQQQHLYLAAYSIGSQLLGPAANGTDVDLIPNFLLGGDTVGGFGCPPPIGGGEFLAANRGYVYVINQLPTCDSNTSVVNLAPEVDVYNTNGITGAHTDIAPILRLALPTGYPLALAVGPSGTVSGGQSLLQSLGRTYRPQLYAGRRLLQRRARPYTSIRHTR